jgi:hypothetical protein
LADRRTGRLANRSVSRCSADVLALCREEGQPVMTQGRRSCPAACGSPPPRVVRSAGVGLRRTDDAQDGRPLLESCCGRTMRAGHEPVPPAPRRKVYLHPHRPAGRPHPWPHHPLSSPPVPPPMPPARTTAGGISPLEACRARGPSPPARGQWRTRFQPCPPYPPVQPWRTPRHRTRHPLRRAAPSCARDAFRRSPSPLLPTT